MIALLAAVHAVVRPDVDPEPVARLVRFGALVRARVCAGEWWRVATGALLHADVSHLVGNAVGILVLGSALVAAVGVARAGAVLAASALAGNVLTLFFGSPAPTVGASGGVFGLLGALVLVRLRAARADPDSLMKREWLKLVGLSALALLATGRAGHTAWMAHLGGFVAGAALAPRARASRPPLKLVGEEEERLRWN